MVFSLILFFIGVMGFLVNRKNLVILLLCLELTLLSVALLLLLSPYSYSDIVAQGFGIYVIAVAAAESAIGLAIIVSFYRLRGSIAMTSLRNTAKDGTAKQTNSPYSEYLGCTVVESRASCISLEGEGYLSLTVPSSLYHLRVLNMPLGVKSYVLDSGYASICLTWLIKSILPYVKLRGKTLFVGANPSHKTTRASFTGQAQIRFLLKLTPYGYDYQIKYKTNPLLFSLYYAACIVAYPLLTPRYQDPLLNRRKHLRPRAAWFAGYASRS
jgi:NADH-ubiquinone oxidoreductase chain 4L